MKLKKALGAVFLEEYNELEIDEDLKVPICFSIELKYYEPEKIDKE